MTPRSDTPVTARAKVVLVVDDDEDLREAIVDVLRQEGFHALDAGDGAEAVEQARQHRPDVVLLDYRLPNGSGTEVLKRLRGSGCSSGTILMTSGENVCEVLTRLGFEQADVLTKPFDLELLVALVDAAVRRNS